jgi:ribosomal protein S12 methylthiotransferase accessory factor YcaO
MPPDSLPGPADPDPAAYELRLIQTSSATGYFAAIPEPECSWEDAFAYLRKHPLDEFMHRHLLRYMIGLDRSQQKRFFCRLDDSDPVVRALFFEIAALDPGVPLPEELSSPALSGEPANRIYTPLIDLKSHALSDQKLHRQWSAFFAENLNALSPLPDENKVGMPPPVPEAAISAALHRGIGIGDLPFPAPVENVMDVAAGSPEETARLALERLQEARILEGPELRHQTSLSPLGLLRRWRFDHLICCSRHRFRLFGNQTSYGRGFSLETARVRCLMEIVERCSAFAGVEKERVAGRRIETPLTFGTFSKLSRAKAAPPLDPNRMRLEAPYENEPLYWLPASRITTEGEAPVMVPFQAVYLFANLDEISLFSGLSSTGLAAGSTTAAARLGALLEVIERDSEALGLFDHSRCFRLAAKDRFVSGLLEDYRDRGIDVFFQDITGFSGVSCFKAFVVHQNGVVAKGAGAHPDGRYALLSALTETPYPYPNGPASAKGPEHLPTRLLEELPNDSAGSVKADLGRIEAVLNHNGFSPVYAELTRADLSIPVVRALVPGLEIMADFDRFSRVGPRLYAAYRSLTKRGRSASSADSASFSLERVSH